MPRHSAAERLPEPEAPKAETPKRPSAKKPRPHWKAEEVALVREGREYLETWKEPGTELQEKDLEPVEDLTHEIDKSPTASEQIAKTLKKQRELREGVQLEDKDLEEIEDLTKEAVHEPDMLEVLAERREKAEREKREAGAARAKERETRAIKEVQAQLAHAAVDELIKEEEEEKRERGLEWHEMPSRPKATTFLERLRSKLPKWLGGE